ncbi:MAG: DUF4442 domain-containing protein [Aestuariibacter sp.]
MKANTLKRMLNIYGPYLGASVRVEEISNDFRYARVAMKLRWFNKNAVHTHFGGSLYSMVDPHYMLMLMKILGKDYIVWDKSASIDFIKPGKGKVTAEFTITDDMLNDIYQHTKDGDKYLPTIQVEVKDENQQVVCKVDKTLYIRKAQNQARRI